MVDNIWIGSSTSASRWNWIYTTLDYYTKLHCTRKIYARIAHFSYLMQIIWILPQMAKWQNVVKFNDRGSRSQMFSKISVKFSVLKCS